MLKCALLSALAAVSMVQAGPIGLRATTSKDISQKVSFDEIKIPIPNTLGAQVNTLLGAYLLSFTNLFLLEPGSAPGKVTVGVPPSSGNNVAAYMQTSTQTIPTISIPAGSNMTSFDLKSFSFGCVQGNGNGGATGTARCNVGVVGYKGTTRVASQLFRFAPALTTKSNPIQALLSSDFTGLTRVIFATTFLPDVANGATYLDDIAFIAHTSLLPTTSSLLPTTTSSRSTSSSTTLSTTSSSRSTSSSSTLSTTSSSRSTSSSTTSSTSLSISLPSVTLPSVTLPSVTLPSVTLPSVTLPSVTLPSVTLPSVTLPSVTLPSVTLPSVTLPSVTLPSVTLPSATLPTGL